MLRHRSAACSLLVVWTTLAVTCSAHDPFKHNEDDHDHDHSDQFNLTDRHGGNGSHPGYRIALCPPTVCEIDLFRRSCFRSKEPLCPTQYKPKATVCCSSGCCVPRSSSLKDFFGKFWLIVAIVFGIVLTSAASVWFRNTSQWNRGFNRRRALNSTDSVHFEADAPIEMTRNPDHPPSYSDALGFPKPSDEVETVANPPAYTDVSFEAPADAAADSRGCSRTSTSTDIGVIDGEAAGSVAAVEQQPAAATASATGQNLDGDFSVHGMTSSECLDSLGEFPDTFISSARSEALSVDTRPLV